MAQQQLGGSFRALASASTGRTINLMEPLGGVLGRTPGSSVIDTISVQLPLGAVWTILAWQIMFQIALAVNGPCNGRLGKVIGGLQSGAVQSNGPAGSPAGQPFTAAMLPLPNEPSLFATLWDGSQDQSPPLISAALPLVLPSNNGEGVISGGQNLSQPMKIVSGDSLSIGMWLTPSVVGAGSGSNYNSLVVFSAAWTITYDDGRAGT